jgi:glucose-1-phosphate thymidylyltransferase
MRKADAAASLDPGQAAAANAGMKGMIPIGRPFLDYLISALADAGFTDVCLVIGPEHGVVREHYEGDAKPTRVRLHYAIQQEPRGTADAVLAAEEFTRGESFVVMNSDNYYPVAALAELHRRVNPAMIAFDRDALVRLGNVSPEKVARFGDLEIDADGYLRRILAKPVPAGEVRVVYVTMNLWLFTSAIFRACREVPLSARGELELPQAVQLAIDEHGMKIEAVRMSAPVLDMSSRADVASMAAALRGVKVVL